MSGTNEGPSKYSMSVSMYRGGARGSGRPRTAPPDLPSLLLDARIVYLGMPVLPLSLSWIKRLVCHKIVVLFFLVFCSSGFILVSVADCSCCD